MCIRDRLRSKQEEAQAAQRLQADFYTGLSDGTMTIAGAREFLSNPQISENLRSTIDAYVSDESDDQIRRRMQDTARLLCLRYLIQIYLMLKWTEGLRRHLMPMIKIN